MIAPVITIASVVLLLLTATVHRTGYQLVHASAPDGTLAGRVYCTSGSRAIVIDYRTVGCQR